MFRFVKIKSKQNSSQNQKKLVKLPHLLWIVILQKPQTCDRLADIKKTWKMSAATIQLVTPDLTHQETILQIVDALDHLDKVTDEVFSNIQAKIQQNATKLADLDSRVDVADQKVKALAEMNQKATCIYSSAKYPEQEEQDYVSAFKDIDQRIDFVKNTSIKVKKPDINLKGLDAKEINEKRRYFHLPVKKKPTTAQLLEESPDLRLPSKNAKSALSYLIFNTAENPYAKTKDFSNPLNNQKTKSKKEEDATDKTSLGEAPASLGIGLDDADGTSDLFFAPALGDLPDLDLPDILDLPNLPTDLSYMTDLGPGIAPSVQQIPDLPEDDGIPEDAEALLAAPPPPPPPSLIPPPPVPTSAPVASSIPPPVPGTFISNLRSTDN